jgi:hypothetical protein
MLFIQPGSLAGASPRGRSRNRRYAAPSSNSPRSSLTTLTHVAGLPLSLADAPLESSRAIVPTTASPTAQASVNTGPFTRPRGVDSMSVTATMAMGLTATATAKGRTWPIAAPIDATLTGALCRGQGSLLAPRQEVKPVIASPIVRAPQAEREVDAGGHRDADAPDDDEDRQRHSLVSRADAGLRDGPGRARGED